MSTTSGPEMPEWHSPLMPYLAVHDAAGAMAFYRDAFDAEITVGPVEMHGSVVHAEMRIGAAHIMLADGGIEAELVRTPNDVGGSTMQLHLYVDDVDAVTQQALAAGAELVRPVEVSFDGRRTGKIRDPFGHNWFLATTAEAITMDELNERIANLF